MRVYFVVSEEMESGGHPYGDPPEPPEWGCIVEIVAAETRSRARWMAWKKDSSSRSLTAADMPNFRCFRLGVADGPARVLDAAEAKAWGLLVTNKMEAPSPRGSKPQWWRRDVAILEGDPGL